MRPRRSTHLCSRCCSLSCRTGTAFGWASCRRFRPSARSVSYSGCLAVTSWLKAWGTREREREGREKGEGRERERNGRREIECWFMRERASCACAHTHTHTHTHTHLMFFNLLLQYASVLIWWRHCLQLCALVLHPQHHVTVCFLKLTSSLGR